MPCLEDIWREFACPQADFVRRNVRRLRLGSRATPQLRRFVWEIDIVRFWESIVSNQTHLNWMNNTPCDESKDSTYCVPACRAVNQLQRNLTWPSGKIWLPSAAWTNSSSSSPFQAATSTRSGQSIWVASEKTPESWQPGLAGNAHVRSQHLVDRVAHGQICSKILTNSRFPSDKTCYYLVYDLRYHWVLP